MRSPRQLDPLRIASLGSGALVLGAAAAGVIVLVMQSLPMWKLHGLRFLLEDDWFYRGDLFGAATMIYATVLVSVIAIVLAAPLGLLSALFLSEVASPRLRLALKLPIELLAGVPSVIYGLLGVQLLRNWVYRLLEPFDPLSGDTLLTGGLLLGLMILPTVVSLSDDALRGVPASQRQASRALGLTRAETALGVVLGQARPGLVAAVVLATGRALGETIAVFLVVGRLDTDLPGSLLSFRPVIEAGQTLTSKLGGSETHLAVGDPQHWGAMLGLALVLLMMASSLSIAGHALSRRGRRDA